MTLKITTASNAKELAAVIEGIPQQAQKEVAKELAYLTQDIRTEIIRSMTQTPKTGRVYDWKEVPYGMHEFFVRIAGRNIPARKRNKPHTASAPGEAPARDTGELVSRILAESFDNGAIVGVIAGAPYAERLEDPEGLNRPFLKPALQKIEPTIGQRVMAAIIASVGGTSAT